MPEARRFLTVLKWSLRTGRRGPQYTQARQVAQRGAFPGHSAPAGLESPSLMGRRFPQIPVSLVGRVYRVTGQVQGVGFRPFVYRLARELAVSGDVRNDSAGVSVRAVATRAALDEFARRIVEDAPPLARVAAVVTVSEESAAHAAGGFSIEPSDAAPADRGRIAIDTAVCDDCLSEMRDPADRRHRHALVNCTNCGPRYTIVRDLPYDRPATTMAAFPMCDACAAEYEDPGDRRFPAQPVSCPDCGPRLAPIDGGEDPIRRAAALLADGAILAVKGLGGYHLAVDATNEAAVARLRAAKGRDAKPFAVMVPDLSGARRLADLSPPAEEALASPVAPIVLAPMRDDTALAPAVSAGCHRAGLMLPYTPIQHLLFDEGLGPLVMTSANRTDDPLVTDDVEVRADLDGVHDAVLSHDREIERAVDDSIAIDTGDGLLPIRRARGLCPAPLPLPIAAPTPGLAVGGELKSAVAVVRGGEAILGQHLGDLSRARAYRRFGRTIDDLLRLYDVAPEWIACDAHPAYLSHGFARRRSEETGVPLVVVQHHHAHLASLLAEHGRSDRAIGIVCDGVGYGGDGTAWGGEILVGDLEDYERFGRLRPLRLPGGDAAAKRTGRCAASWIFDTLGPEGLSHPALARALRDDAEREAVGGMLEADLRCPPSSGAGRLFDAAAALLGVCTENRYEAMSGLLLEAAASRATERPSGGGLLDLRERDGLLEIDTRPLLSRLLDGIGGGEATEDLAYLFHDALADGLAGAAASGAEETGIEVVGLSGGVFCNVLLTDRLVQRLRAKGLAVLVHRQVPPNDGGIAYGQAAVAAARLSRETN